MSHFARFRLHSCVFKKRREDQLHCVSFTTPFRGTVTVLEVTTPNLVVSKRVSLSAALCSSGSLRIFFLF